MTLEQSGGVVDNVKEVAKAIAPDAGAHQDQALRALQLLVGGTETYLLDLLAECGQRWSYLETATKITNKGGGGGGGGGGG